MKHLMKSPGDYKLSFGLHKGKTLAEVFEENPGYIDWLASQDWLYKSTMQKVLAFRNLPHVEQEIDRRYWHTDAWGNELITYECFLPSEQTSKKVLCEEEYAEAFYPTPKSRKPRHRIGRRLVERSTFAQGKPTWIKIEYGPNRPLPWKPSAKVQAKIARGTKKPLKDEYRPRSAGPQEPERDWKPTPMKPSEAWDLAADLLIAIDNAECVEDIELIEKEDRIDQLKDYLPQKTMEQIRQAYRDKRDRFALIALLPDWKRRDALLALDAIREEPQLENVLKEQAPELHDAVELLRLS